MRPVTDLERKVAPFRVVSEFQPSGDQPTAIDELERRVNDGDRDIVLLGATGTGKSATTAWLVERLQRPTLVMAPNKTLAAQLANEFRELLPHNAVETTTTTSQRHTSRRPTPTSRRTPRSTTRSSGCGTRPRTAC
jgi:excinuclease ABC subunit B